VAFALFWVGYRKDTERHVTPQLDIGFDLAAEYQMAFTLFGQQTGETS
jgi:hypothetical protein